MKSIRDIRNVVGRRAFLIAPLVTLLGTRATLKSKPEFRRHFRAQRNLDEDSLLIRLEHTFFQESQDYSPPNKLRSVYSIQSGFCCKQEKRDKNFHTIQFRLKEFSV